LLIIPAPGAVAQEKMAMADTIKGERCADCGELFMPHRIVEEKGELLCRTCWTKRKHEEGDLESVKEIPRRGNMAEPSPRNPWIWVGLAAGALVLVALVLVMILR
jgi:NMD protein affecting ribosome stability and mRNA decay